MGLGASGLSPRGLGLCSLIGCSGFPTRRSVRLGAGGGGLVAGLRVDRPVGVLPHWGVIAVASHWPLGTQPPLATRALNTITSYLNVVFALYWFPSSSRSPPSSWFFFRFFFSSFRGFVHFTSTGLLASVP